MARKRVTDAEYQRLLEFRYGLRRFLHWSESQARNADLSPKHHQLLLAIKGHPDPKGPTISDVSRYLMIKHHSAVELVDRAARAGLVERVYVEGDRGRTTRLRCTSLGLDKLASLTRVTLEELSRLGPELSRAWEGLDEGH